MRTGIKTLLPLSILLTALWLGLKFFLPILFPFALGLGLALCAEPLVSFLERKVHLPRPLCAGVGVSAAFGAIMILLLLLCAFLIRELSMLAGILPDLNLSVRTGLTAVQSWLLTLAQRAPKSIAPLIRENVTSLFSDGTALVDTGIQYLLSLAGNILSHIPDSALSLGTAVISGFMLSAKLPKLRRWVLRSLSRERLQPLIAGWKNMKTAVGGWILAQLKLAGVTLGILLAGFLLLRVEYAPLWALGICVLDAFPVLGTGTILLPWALVCFLQGDTARAVGLLGIYTVISLVRSVLEPRLVGKELGLDPLLTLMALYAGYKLWGLPGMLFAPLLVVTAMQLLPKKET